MNPVYRSLFFAFLSIISLAITCNRCTQRQARQQQQQLTLSAGWTPELEKVVYDEFYQQTTPFDDDNNAKVAFANCCVRKLKELLPNGIASANAMLTDSMKAEAVKIGLDCAKPFMKKPDVWSPELIEQFKLQVYSFDETKLLKPQMRKEYVDCITFKVIAKYPNGIGDTINKKTIKAFMAKTRMDCLKLIANKYGNIKKLDTAVFKAN